MIDAFFATPVGQAVVVIALLAVLDFGLGVFAAIRDDVFTFDALAAWVRKTLLGRIAPIFGTLIVGYVAGGLSLDDGVSGVLTPGTIITGIGLVAGTAYVLEVIASIRESFVPKPGVRDVPVE
jgi:hypothetical protein